MPKSRTVKWHASGPHVQAINAIRKAATALSNYYVVFPCWGAEQVNVQPQTQNRLSLSAPCFGFALEVCASRASERTARLWLDRNPLHL